MKRTGSTSIESMPKGRTAALLAAGVLAVHELRYLAGYGEYADAASVAGAHEYLSVAGPLVAAVLAAACGRFVAVLLNARRTGRSEARRPRLATAWAAASSILAAAYVGQESLEALLHPGHPGGLASVLGEGGWTALVLAVAVGALIALLLRGASAAIVLAARRRRARPRSWPLRGEGRPRPALSSASAPLARHLAGRAPPRPSFV